MKAENPDIQQAVEQELEKWKNQNGKYEKERLQKRTADMMAELKRRDEERQIQRIEKAKAELERSRSFAENIIESVEE